MCAEKNYEGRAKINVAMVSIFCTYASQNRNLKKQIIMDHSLEWITEENIQVNWS